MARPLAGLAGLGLLAGFAVLVLRQPAVQDRILERVVTAAVARAPQHLGSDGLAVLLCGSSGPLPHPTRARPCTAVFAGERFFVVDVGPGSWNRLALWRVDGARIGGILLTHLHSDHIGELGEYDLQTWVAGRPGPLAVYGPPGVERVVAGFEEAYAADSAYRVAHHGADLLPEEAGRLLARPVRGPAEGDGPSLVLDEEGLRITAFAVDHTPVHPAYGYRFDYRGRSVVVSGDTAPSAALVEAARNADVLVHEAQADHVVARLGAAAAAGGRPRVARIMADIPDYHSTPVEAARAANAARVKLLILTHLTPPPPALPFEWIYVRGVEEARDGAWLLGDDGLLVELPAGSDAVEVGSLE